VAITRSEQKATRAVLQKKFIQTSDGTWRHEGCEIEIEAHSWAVKQATDGRKCALASSATGHATAYASAYASRICQLVKLVNQELVNQEIINNCSSTVEDNRKDVSVPAAESPSAAVISASMSVSTPPERSAPPSVSVLSPTAQSKLPSFAASAIISPEQVRAIEAKQQGERRSIEEIRRRFGLNMIEEEDETYR
jgi:hypothetical protein